MKIKIGVFIVSCILMAACGGATGGLTGSSAPAVGDSVVFKTSAIVYGEGKVEKVEGGKYEIRSGSNIAKADAADVYALPKAGSKTEIKPGDIVVAFQRETYWSAGEVKAVNGDVIEVFTSKSAAAGPSRDWLQFVKSPRARSKIRQWFTKERREEAIERGKDQIAKLMRKEGLPLTRLMTHDVLALVAEAAGRN